MTVPVPTANAAFLLDESGTILTWNTACERLLMLPADRAIGCSLTRLLAAETPPAVALAESHAPMTVPLESAAGAVDAAAEAAADAQAVQAALDDPAMRWRGLAADHGRTNKLLLRRGDGGTVIAELALSPQYDAGGVIQSWVAAIDNLHDDSTPEAVLVGRTPLAAVVAVLPGTFYAINRAGRFVLWNRNHERITELMPEEVEATSAVELFDLKTRPLIADSIRRVFETGEEVVLEADVLGRSGRETPMLLCGSRVSCNGGHYLFGMGLDITQRRAHEQALRLRERALHAASNGIVITAIQGNDCSIEYVNPAFERISGYRAEDVIGRDSRFMAAPGMDGNERARIRDAIAARRPVNVVFRNMRKNGELFWNDLSITPVLDEHGQTSHFIGVIMDVTATKQRTAHLEHEVNHDPLTGLANRNLLWDRLEHALHLAQRQKSLVATVLIDLNNFKSINDTHGHEAGDVVLKVVAKRLLASVRDSDTVARLSGDEFVLVLVNQPSLRFTLRMIERLRQGLTQPVSFMHKEIAVGASLGVSVYPHDGHTAAELVRSADVAMYHAKATGRNEIYFFSSDMKSTTDARQQLDAGMAHAIERNELFMLYQPCVDARSGTVKSFEALLRWRHPERGVLLPSAFLTEAEESGRIVQFGAWVLDQVCAFLRELKALGVTGVPVSVNVSAREYVQQDFVANIAKRLAQHGLAPDSLQIELREEALIRNPGQVRDLAGQLRELGLTLSVDEFGHGMSDLGFLRELSVGQLKLSKQAVHAIAENEDAREGNVMARTLIDIGHNLRMPVIGEAVETRSQMEFLTAHGCEGLQGTWLGEPMEAEAARELVRDRMPA
jgi:diguanylate cyclase (GGDEF)-like protein/PAS domain S-box-containing protein